MRHKADLPFLSVWLMQNEACSIPASDKCVHSHMHVDFHVQAHTHTRAYMCIGIAATLCMRMCLMWICIFAHTCKLMLTSLLKDIYITFHILYIHMPHSIHANIYTHIWVSIHVHCHTGILVHMSIYMCAPVPRFMHTRNVHTTLHTDNVCTCVCSHMSMFMCIGMHTFRKSALVCAHI